MIATKENLNWFLSGMVIAFIVLLFYKCEDKPLKPAITKMDSIKHTIDTLKVDVIKWKESKSKIVYRTKFEPTVTIDTVLVNLKKCDTIVKIDSVIIHRQDTIIVHQDTIIVQQEELIEDLNKDIKKQKRKLLFTKILAGAIIVLTIFVAK